ncbi:hypothetical protein [Sabulibacter ruber]|uniref:hypothetical protein n=1 Tax=Sabulibacter ruber TaxID=2811901 RepID=UPI001A958747|nr:hypothetical protein [Sabulibacter ruber]
MEKKIDLNKFLALVEVGRFSELEIYNYVEALTGGFDQHKLGLMQKTVKQYIIDRKEEYFTEQETNLIDLLNLFPDEDKEFPFKEIPDPETFFGKDKAKLIKILKKYYDEGKGLPFKEIPDPDTFIKNEKRFAGTILILDKEKLFGNAIHFQLYLVYELQNLISAKLAPQLHKPLKPKHTPTGISIKFIQLLTEEGKKILPFLLDAYRGSKIKEYSLMFLSLKALGYLTEEVNGLSDGKIVEALRETFGERVGSRASFNKALNDYGIYIDSTRKAELNRHIQRIKEAFGHL